jgi:hypothetical protein
MGLVVIGSSNHIDFADTLKYGVQENLVLNSKPPIVEISRVGNDPADVVVQQWPSVFRRGHYDIAFFHNFEGNKSVETLCLDFFKHHPEARVYYNDCDESSVKYVEMASVQASNPAPTKPEDLDSLRKVKILYEKDPNKVVERLRRDFEISLIAEANPAHAAMLDRELNDQCGSLHTTAG